MSEYIHKSHNVSVLLYHLVFLAKYRRAVFDEQVDEVLREVCLEIEQRYEIKFVEIGVDKDHVHFLVQSVPTYSGSLRIWGERSNSVMSAVIFEPVIEVDLDAVGET